MRRALRLAVVGILSATALVVASPAASAQTPAEAVASAVGNASANGVTSFISVVDRKTGAVLSQTGNAGAQVASESIMKLILAAYYLRMYGGYDRTPQGTRDRLQYMLIYSDDDTASSMFTTSAIPTIAAVYGLGSTINATDRAGHWGAARITAADMTTFLYRAANDPWVGPWLIPVMSQTAANGSDGFDQYFGMNRLTGEHGSKQGWGCDSFWTSPQCAIHSVGYTDRYFVAILQLGGYPDPMRWTSTTSAGLIQQSTVSLRDGDFVCEASTGRVFRLAGGAPLHVSSWTPFGGEQPCRSLSDAEFARLPQYPANGTFIEDAVSGAVYRIAGGAPVYVSTWSAFGGGQPRIAVDPAAIERAGTGAPYDHLRYYPADNTFLRGTGTGAVYRIAGGAPVYVSVWSAFDGVQPTVDVDEAAIDRAGSGSFYGHLRYYPADGTFVRGKKGGTVYRIAGGAPVVVTDWSAFGGSQTTVNLDPVALDMAGSGGYYDHLRYRPVDGTFVRATSTGAVYRIAGGAPVYVSNWSAVGGPQTTIDIDSAAVDRAGSGAAFDHLRYFPADGTFVRVMSNGNIYRIAGGAPLFVAGWTALGGAQPSTDVDPAAISRSGTGGYYAHLNYYPADGTFLEGLPGGRVYRVASRVPTYVPSWDPWGGVQPYTRITQQTIDRGGSGGVYNHLAPPR